jgi:hypothetical protein
MVDVAIFFSELLFADSGSGRSMELERSGPLVPAPGRALTSAKLATLFAICGCRQLMSPMPPFIHVSH